MKSTRLKFIYIFKGGGIKVLKYAWGGIKKGWHKVLKKWGGIKEGGIRFLGGGIKEGGIQI